MNVRVIEKNSELHRRGNALSIERLRVAPYCRVSSGSEEQRSSYNSQVAHYKDLVLNNKDWELVEVYADEGISGTQINKRLGFQKMISDAIDGKIDMITIKKIRQYLLIKKK